MAWSASGVFKEFIVNPGTIGLTGATKPTTMGASYDADTIKVALYNNSITPDKNATLAQTGYNSGSSQWLTANEVTDATNWVAGGRALSGDAFTSGSGYGCMYDATDLAGGGTLTLAATYGCLVYDDTVTGGTVADQGACFNYFGGAQQVTNGTFTIVWHANGIFRITV